MLIIFTCPSIIYEIIITKSIDESGNFNGDLVVSISNARTTGSAGNTISLFGVIVI